MAFDDFVDVLLVDEGVPDGLGVDHQHRDRKSTRLNSSHVRISYAVFCLKKKKTPTQDGEECAAPACPIEQKCLPRGHCSYSGRALRSCTLCPQPSRQQSHLLGIQ